MTTENRVAMAENRVALAAVLESLISNGDISLEDILAAAEYRLTPGREQAQMVAMRRELDKHLAKPGGTLGNYQW